MTYVLASLQINGGNVRVLVPFARDAVLVKLEVALKPAARRRSLWLVPWRPVIKQPPFGMLQVPSITHTDGISQFAYRLSMVGRAFAMISSDFLRVSATAFSYNCD
jgi:hypothetical protein